MASVPRTCLKSVTGNVPAETEFEGTKRTSFIPRKRVSFSARNEITEFNKYHDTTTSSNESNMDMTQHVPSSIENIPPLNLDKTFLGDDVDDQDENMSFTRSESIYNKFDASYGNFSANTNMSMTKVEESSPSTNRNFVEYNAKADMSMTMGGEQTEFQNKNCSARTFTELTNANMSKNTVPGSSVTSLGILYENYPKFENTPIKMTEESTLSSRCSNNNFGDRTFTTSKMDMTMTISEEEPTPKSRKVHVDHSSTNIDMSMTQQGTFIISPKTEVPPVDMSMTFTAAAVRVNEHVNEDTMRSMMNVTKTEVQPVDMSMTFTAAAVRVNEHVDENTMRTTKAESVTQFQQRPFRVVERKDSSLPQPLPSSSGNKVPKSTRTKVPVPSMFGKFGLLKTPKRPLPSDLLRLINQDKVSKTTIETTPSLPSPPPPINNQAVQTTLPHGEPTSTETSQDSFNRNEIETNRHVISYLKEETGSPVLAAQFNTFEKSEVVHTMPMPTFNSTVQNMLSTINSTTMNKISVQNSTLLNITVNSSVMNKTSGVDSNPNTLPCIPPTVGSVPVTVVPCDSMSKNNLTMSIEESDEGIQHILRKLSINTPICVQDESTLYHLSPPPPQNITLMEKYSHTIKTPKQDLSTSVRKPEMKNYTPTSSFTLTRSNSSSSVSIPGASLVEKVKSTRGHDKIEALQQLSKQLELLNDSEFDMVMNEIVGFVHPSFIQGELKRREYASLMNCTEFPTDPNDPAFSFAKRIMNQLYAERCKN